MPEISQERIGETIRLVTACVYRYSVHVTIKTLFRNHLFHITMARMFAEQDVLLGYKYALGNKHLDPDVHLWILDEWNKDLKKNAHHKLLPKRLSTPILPILKKIEHIRKNI